MSYADGHLKYLYEFQILKEKYGNINNFYFIEELLKLQKTRFLS